MCQRVGLLPDSESIAQMGFTGERGNQQKQKDENANWRAQELLFDLILGGSITPV